MSADDDKGDFASSRDIVEKAAELVHRYKVAHNKWAYEHQSEDHFVILLAAHVAMKAMLNAFHLWDRIEPEEYEKVDKLADEFELRTGPFQEGPPEAKA